MKKGQLVQAVVLHIDADNRRLSLGVKQLQPDAWETFFRTHMVGDIRARKGLPCVELRGVRGSGAGVEGLCHNSEIPPSRASGKARSPLPIGEEWISRSSRLNEAEKKIGLSVRALADDEGAKPAGRLPAAGRSRPSRKR